MNEAAEPRVAARSPAIKAIGIAAACLTAPDAHAHDLSFRTAGSVAVVAAHDGADFTRSRDKAGVAIEASVEASLGKFSSRLAIDQTSTNEIGSRDLRVTMKDAWVRYSTGRLDVTVGKQFLPEGRSDRLRPQDQFAPRDLTRIATVEARQRISLPAVRLDYALNDRFTVSTFYIRQNQGYVLPFRLTRSLPVGETLDNSPVDAGLAEVQFRNTGFELGVSLSRGASPLPAIGFGALGLRQAVVRQTRLAVSGSYSVGPGVMRWDMAGIANDDQGVVGVERRGLFGSIGYDVGPWTDANLSIQLIGRRSWRCTTPVGFEELALSNGALQQTSRDAQVWATVNLRQSFRSDHELEGGGLISAIGEYAAYGAWRWRLTDSFRVSTQVQGGRGPRRSLVETVLPEFRVFTEAQFTF